MQLWDCDIRGADHLAWAGLGTANHPKARSVANVTLWGAGGGVGGLVFGALLYFCLKVHNLSFSEGVFQSVLQKKWGVLNERENVGLNLGAGIDCDSFWSCDELGAMEVVFPKMEGDIVSS